MYGDLIFYIVFCTFAYLFTKIVSPTANGSGVPEMKVTLLGNHLPGLLTLRTLIAKVVGLTLVYLYVSYKNQNIAKEKKIDTNPFNLQALASELSVLAAIIILYVVITTDSDNYSILAGAENPVL